MTDDLAGRGLVVRRVDDALRTETDPWLEAVSRGFLGGERTDVQRDAFFAHTAYRRKIGVFDETAPQPDVPVATFASWAAELTLPGGTVAACAISSVTVAPTHRRRGILRSVMTGELRTAVERGASRRDPHRERVDDLRPFRLRAGRARRAVDDRRPSGAVGGPRRAGTHRLRHSRAGA